jgi:uncharacterized protein (DUF1778 family)
MHLREIGVLMMAKTRRQQITVTVPEDVRAALERAAEREHRTMSNLAQHLLATALEGHRHAEQTAA